MKLVFDNLNDHKQGFTLIEIVIIVAILGAITAIMAMTFGMVTRTTTTDTAQNLMMSQVNQAASWIAKDVESASSVTTDNATELCSVQRYVWNGSDITGTTTIDYIVTGGVLRRSVNGGPGTPVAQFISFPDAATSFKLADASPFQTNTYILKLRAVYKNGEYKQEYKIRQRAP